jgi:hypothetical protein
MDYTTPYQKMGTFEAVCIKNGSMTNKQLEGLLKKAIMPPFPQSVGFAAQQTSVSVTSRHWSRNER